MPEVESATASQTPDQPPRHLTLRQTANPMAAYAERPLHVTFRDQEPGELVELLLRRHIVTNTGWVVIVILGLIAPFAMASLDFSQLIGLQWVEQIPQRFDFAIALLWYLAIIGFGLISFLNWYFNVYLISSRRLIDVDFLGLLFYKSAETQLTMVQDVEHRRAGIWQALFNYGTVNIQTAATEQNLVFERVPKPAEVADIITDLIPEERDRSYRNLEEVKNQQRPQP